MDAWIDELDSAAVRGTRARDYSPPIGCERKFLDHRSSSALLTSVVEEAIEGLFPDHRNRARRLLTHVYRDGKALQEFEWFRVVAPAGISVDRERRARAELRERAKAEGRPFAELVQAMTLQLHQEIWKGIENALRLAASVHPSLGILVGKKRSSSKQPVMHPLAPMSIAQYARAAGMSIQTARNYGRMGKIPGYHEFGRKAWVSPIAVLSSNGETSPRGERRSDGPADRIEVASGHSSQRQALLGAMRVLEAACEVGPAWKAAREHGRLGAAKTDAPGDDSGSA